MLGGSSRALAEASNPSYSALNGTNSRDFGYSLSVKAHTVVERCEGTC